MKRAELQAKLLVATEFPDSTFWSAALELPFEEVLSMALQLADRLAAECINQNMQAMEANLETDQASKTATAELLDRLSKSLH